MSDPRPSTEAELVDFLRSIDVPAPDSLHHEVQALIDARSRRGARRPGAGRGTRRGTRPFAGAPRLAAVGAILAAILAVAIAFESSGGGSSTLSLGNASALTLRPATTGPPGESSANGAQLEAGVDGVSFPYWGERFGWRATGTRTDRLDGRTVRTIFYANARGARIGYAIVAGGSPPQLSGGVVSRHDGTPYRLLSQHGAPVVMWLRRGHLCIVSGRHVSGATLLRLASWDERSRAS
jgi:hypothetical protein